MTHNATAGRQRLSPQSWNDPDRALMRATEELRDAALMSDATWNQSARRFDDQQMVELLILVGHFASVAAFQNTAAGELQSRLRGALTMEPGETP